MRTVAHQWNQDLLSQITPFPGTKDSRTVILWKQTDNWGMMIGFLKLRYKASQWICYRRYLMVYLSPGSYHSNLTLWQREESFWSANLIAWELSMVPKKYVIKNSKNGILPVFLIFCHGTLYFSAISCFRILYYSLHLPGKSFASFFVWQYLYLLS